MKQRLLTLALDLIIFLHTLTERAYLALWAARAELDRERMMQ
jgi:hypothetical protein